VVQSEGHKQLQQCHFLFHQALDADEAGNKDEAVELYTQAVELGIRAVSVQRMRMSNETCYLCMSVCRFSYTCLSIVYTNSFVTVSVE
jgi:hypothetical protein